ncbi:hypothetical protein [Tepidiforma sp.]|uniref:hypothetical protein n=1 Tax=Tepidiforma sp. TaxID=2682230 RepID=UPI002ADD38C2|nr:hypothetical protein [Tepidiforma sp.]
MARPFNRFAHERLTAPKLALVAAALAAYAAGWSLLYATNDLGHDQGQGPPPTVPAGTSTPPALAATAATPAATATTENQPTPTPTRRSRAS